MSKYPTIPDFNTTPESMATALRAVKEAVGILCGQRQGDSLGAPEVYAQAFEPKGGDTSRKKGDFWVDTRVNKLNFWNGKFWERCV
jgi:hypothetical protein